MNATGYNFITATFLVFWGQKNVLDDEHAYSKPRNSLAYHHVILPVSRSFIREINKTWTVFVRDWFMDRTPSKWSAVVNFQLSPITFPYLIQKWFSLVGIRFGPCSLFRSRQNNQRSEMARLKYLDTRNYSSFLLPKFSLLRTFKSLKHQHKLYFQITHWFEIFISFWYVSC